MILSNTVEKSTSTVLITDNNGKLEYISPHYTKISGYSSNEVIGKSLLSLMSDEMSQGFRKEFWDQIITGNKWDGRLCYKKENGGIFWQYMSIDSIKDENGQIKHFVAVNIDDTVLNIAMNYSKHIEKQFPSIPESFQEAIISFDENNNILVFNDRAETVYGYMSDEIIGKPLSIIFPDRFKDAYQKEIKHFKNSTDEFLQLNKTCDQLCGLNKNSEEFLINAMIAKFIENDGTIYFVAVLRNVPKREKILIIDDDQAVIDSIYKTLKRENFEIISAYNGKEGLNLLEKESPILIILDIRMPVMNGIDFLNRIKIKATYPYSIIIMTGHGDNDEIKKCFELGIISFLRKPYNIYELIGLVRNTINTKKTQIDFFDINRQLVTEQNTVKVLRGLIPICASCKSIRDDKGYWQIMENYIANNSEADFTHSICPDCATRLYPGIGDPEDVEREMNKDDTCE